MLRDTGPQGAQLISRAADVLRAIPRGVPGGRRLKDLALSTGLTEPTVRRILMGLIHEGFVVQDRKARLYRLGPLSFELGLASGFHSDLIAMCQPHLQALAADTRLTAILGIRARNEAVALAQVEGDVPILGRIAEVGERLLLGVGAGGIPLLAALSDHDINEILSAPAYDHTHVTQEEIRNRVAFAREHGYADIVDRPIVGLRGVAMAVPTAKGISSLYLSLVSTRERFDELSVEQILNILRMTAERLGAALDLR